MRTSLIALLVFSGCAPVLRFTRPTPPEGSFGNIRTLSVHVSTDVGQNVETAVERGLFQGEIPVPISADNVVKERITARLTELGYVVCPQAPCGDGTMNVKLLEAAVGTEFTGTSLRSRSRIRARIIVKQNDGQEPYDWTFTDRRSGRPDEAPMLVRGSADSIASNMAGTLLPGRAHAKLTLEDGGQLSQGVNMLLSSNWDGAISYFSQLTQQQPENAGACTTSASRGRRAVIGARPSRRTSKRPRRIARTCTWTRWRPRDGWRLRLKRLLRRRRFPCRFRANTPSPVGEGGVRASQSNVVPCPSIGVLISKTPLSNENPLVTESSVADSVSVAPA